MKGLPQKQNVIQRDDFIKIIQSAIQLKHYRFAAEMVDQWLSSYPKDIVISYYKALLLFVANPSSVASHQEAIKLLEDICQKDAEYTDAVFLLFNISTSLKNPVADSFKEIYYVLSGKSESLSQIWSRSLYKARFYLNTGNFEEAEQLIQETLKIVLPSPKTAKSINNLDALLSAVTHIQILYRKVKQNSLADTPSLLSLVDFYHNIWDKNLVFKLIQADLLMEGGRSDNAVNILHQTASEDISGEIAERCFGKNHPYLSLWTRDISIKIETSIPASIAAQLGWNQLPNPTDFPSVDKSLFSELNTSYDIPPSYETEEQNQQSVENLSYTTDDDLITALDEIAKNLRAPLPSHTDARYPVYLILSSKQHLKKQYGEDGFKRIDESLVKLAEFTNQLPGWNARILYVDDTSSAAANGIKPVLATDPWAIKLSLKDLDRALQKTGEMIGALLIVGGHEIIPFHSLPNPVDDPDTEVFSDNPYATTDENYFIPEWSVGRITTGTSSDASKLVDIIERIIADRTQKNDQKPWYLRLIQTIINWLSPTQNLMKTSVGYTAAIWKDASLAVFNTIGDSRDLLISPPTNFSSFNNGKIIPSKLGYFNLHGVEDSPEWYGQRDPMNSFFTDTDDTDSDHRLWDDDYPIALRPQNLDGNTQIPEVIFTEACYGAYINQKSIDDALSLKFLSSGTKAFAGATSTAYGSVTTPLTAADLLCKLFWQYIQDGYSAGPALMQAKISLAKEMNQRQGYLDGEDQKTLIQFILLGDPLAKFNSRSSKGKAVDIHQTSRSTEPSQVITVQEKSLSEDTPNIDPLTLETIKEAVAKYLPGMTNAEMNISQMVTSSSYLQDKKATALSSTKTYNTEKLPYQVITLRKSVNKYSAKHIHIARLTVDQKGNIIKMTYSR